MIEIADFLTGIPRRRLEQAQRYLDHFETPPSDYLVAPQDRRSGQEPVRIVYSPPLYAGRAPVSDVTLSMRHGPASFRTHLYDAVRLLVLMTHDPRWRERMQAFDAEAPTSEVWTSLGLDPRQVFRDRAITDATGVYIAPADDLFAYISVDTHGEMTREAEARDPAVIAFQFAAMRAYEQEKVGNKFGAFAA